MSIKIIAYNGYYNNHHHPKQVPVTISLGVSRISAKYLKGISPIILIVISVSVSWFKHCRGMVILPFPRGFTLYLINKKGRRWMTDSPHLHVNGRTMVYRFGIWWSLIWRIVRISLADSLLVVRVLILRLFYSRA